MKENISAEAVQEADYHIYILYHAHHSSLDYCGSCFKMSKLQTLLKHIKDIKISQHEEFLQM